MLFAPIYIAMTFIKSWRIRSFRSRLLEFLSGNTSVAFCKVPENAAETPTLSSKLCTNPKKAYLCDLLDYTNTTRICSMKPHQGIELTDWVTCAGGMPLGAKEPEEGITYDIDLLLECEMVPHEDESEENFVSLENLGQPVAWKAGTHLAIVLRSNIEQLSVAGFQFVNGEFLINHGLPVVRMQTVILSGDPNKATDPSMRSLRTEVQRNLRLPSTDFEWPIHASLLRKLSKVVDIKTENKNSVEVNGTGDHVDTVRRPVMLADVSVNTGRSLLEDETSPEVKETISNGIEQYNGNAKPNDSDVVLENVTVEIQHNITPRKSSLKLDLKKGTSSLSASLLNISSQIKSVTTHKRIVTTSGPKKPLPLPIDAEKDESVTSSPKSVKSSRPLINTKSPNVIIYSDSVVARDNLEASLRKVLDRNRYTVYSVTKESLESGAWRGRAALVAVAGSVGRAAPLLLAHLLDGGRLLALCSDVLHTVLPYYKTAEVRENEIVQFTFDKWKSVKMKHHIFCYQASPAKKQFSTENDRQPSKYTGHPGHELAISVLASEQTWRTPSLLQATDTTNHGVAIFSQIHLEADPSDYLTSDAAATEVARVEILHRIVGDILGLHVQDPHTDSDTEYQRGFFLGNHVHKQSVIEEWCAGREGRVCQLGDVTVQFCYRGDQPRRNPSEDFLPVYVHDCPEHFDTVEYFDNLTSSVIGRLVIYSDVLVSTMNFSSIVMKDGLTIVARSQTGGKGRGGNKWLSTPGQALVTVQFRRRMSPKVSLVQHAASLAAVLAVRAQTLYKDLDIRIKWPNDIYYGREVKIGGNLTKADCIDGDVIVSTGTGVNISNSEPTTCINDIISVYNVKHNTKLPTISVEKFLALFCSKLEEMMTLLDRNSEELLDLYSYYWLHDNEEIRIIREGETTPTVGRIIGVDSSGWLQVRTDSGHITTVAPDGNTFDMMSGLIAPK